MRKVLGVLILLAAVPSNQAGAQAPALPPPNRALGKDPEPLPAVVAMSVADCQRLLSQPRGDRQRVEHRPDADVAFQPGVGARGQPVTPADLPAGGAGILAPNFLLELKFTLTDLLGSRAPARAGAAALTVGRLELDPTTGQLRLDSQPVDPIGEDKVVAACRAELARQPQR